MKKHYDLEERTLLFAKNTRDFLNKLPKTPMSIDDARQLVRSSGSVGANYIEANESSSKKDFIYRIKICRKEAKESQYWLKIITSDMPDMQGQLLQEATELTRIFGSMVEKFRVQ